MSTSFSSAIFGSIPCSNRGGANGIPALFFPTSTTCSLTTPLHTKFRQPVIKLRRSNNSQLYRSFRTYARRRHKNNKDEGESGEDAFEALFSHLEEDLKNDSSPLTDEDEEITDEHVQMLEKELAGVLGEVDDEDIASLHLDTFVNVEDDGEDEDNEEGMQLTLKNWQLKRLASALKVGRRKTNIKGLAGELGLERGIVLALLRDPPPKLLMMSASLPDKVVKSPIRIDSKASDEAPKEEEVNDIVSTDSTPRTETMTEGKEPIHIMRNRWAGKKRIKKVQLATLEKVYDRSKRPTNAMISSIVHVTNLPRKSVVKWFEDKRLKDGVPAQRVPYERDTSDQLVQQHQPSTS